MMMRATVAVAGDRLTVEFRRGARIVEVWGVANPQTPVEALARTVRLRLRQLGVERVRRAGPGILS